MLFKKKKEIPIEVIAEFVPRYVFFENHEKFTNNFKLKWQHPELVAFNRLLKGADEDEREYAFSQNQWLEIYLFCFGCIIYFFEKSPLGPLASERKNGFLAALIKSFWELLAERGLARNKAVLEKSQVYFKALKRDLQRTTKNKLYSEYGILLAENIFGTERKTYKEKREDIKIATNAPYYFQIVTKATQSTCEALSKEYELV